MMTLQELKVLTDKLDSLEESDLLTVVKCFRFDEMLCISHHDFAHFRLLLRFLTKLINKKPFFKMPFAVKHSLEFVLTNILTAKGVEEHMLDDFSDLFHILSYIVKRSINTNTLKCFILDQKDRCFEAVAFGSTLAGAKTDCVSSCLGILSELLKNVEDLNNVASQSTSMVFQSFEKMKVFRELTMLCCLVCERFPVSSEVCKLCISWFFTTGAENFKMAADEDTKLAILKTTNVTFSKLNDLQMPPATEEMPIFKESLETYKKASLKVSSQILLLSKSPSLRDEAMKLFYALFSEFSDDCDNVVGTEICRKLPEDIEEWPKSGEMLFFEIVAFLCKHDRPCWRAKSILTSMASLIYSKQVFRIDHRQMKPLTYIYAMLIEESPTRENFLLGDILLILMTNYFNVSEILTLDIRQLIWILTRAETKLKTATLHHWLKCSENVEEIAKVVVECKALCTMYSFIKNQDSEEIVCKRAIDVLTETGDPECAKFIARMLTQTYKQPKIYNKLMLAGPSLFDHRDDALNMARFVSLVLVTVADEKAFRASCRYLDDLSSKWKDDPAIFGAVFSDVRVIRFLLIKMKYVSEDTTVVILDLLKTLLVLQKRHCIHVDVKLSINLDAALSGSEYKASKGMDILHLIMTNEDTFFQMDDKLVQSAVFTLFDLCKRQEIESKCLRCLSVVMKAHSWLAFKSSTHVFVETKCLLAIEGGSCAQFVAFLYVWLRVLRGGGAQQEGYVAHAGIVRNYLQRVDILIRLRESKKRKLFRLLKPLEMLRDRMFDQGHAV